MGRSLALLVVLAGLAGLAVPALASAQDAAGGPPPKKAGEPAGPTYKEIERGAVVSSDIGAIFYFSVPGEGGALSSGAIMGFGAGYDITKELQLGLVGWGQAIGADATYKGIDDTAVDPKRARGDFHSLLLGASARFAPLSFADENEVDRTFIYVRAAAGAALSRPVGIIDDSGFFVAGGPGVEYFTRLRHFSIGLEVDGIATIVDAGTAVGMSILPHVAYSF